MAELPEPDSPWGPTFSEMKRVSGLDDREFGVFLRDLEFDFGTSLPARPHNPTRDEASYFGDLERLTGELLRIVADRSRTIEVDRTKLLALLGWEARLEFKNKHELHVDLNHYEPIAATIAELENAIRNLPSGYLLLAGTPGSGKSSLLTVALRQEDVRLIRYYAFIPRGFNADRGESVNFLHDVILSIEQESRFRTGLGLNAFDRLHLLERLRNQLVLLHEDYIETGRKTIIVIDGLDHIAREQRPDRSLLDDLLPPNEIPEGVIFVLGSQSDTVLPTPIRVAVQIPERRIAIQVLAREAVFAILSRGERTLALSTEQKDLVFQLSGGHPLALHYLLNQLEVEGADVTAILGSAHPYGESITDQYRTHWPRISEYPELVKLLGRLARLRRPFDLGWVEKWAGEEPVIRLQAQIPHYFRRERGRWAFFHNSFQQFILVKTLERNPGEVDAAIGRRIHLELADQFSQELKNSPWNWEELYHRLEASDLEWFDTHPTLDEMREQLLQFRPLEAIKVDLRLALRAVAIRENPLAFVRLTLAISELNQREFHLENVTLIQPLLAVGEDSIALEHIRDADRLRVSPESALRLAELLYRDGEQGEARALFDLAQPLEMLSGERPVDVHYGERSPKVLRRWVCAALALRQRTIEQVVESIYRLRLRDVNPRGDSSDAALTEAAQTELLMAAGQKLIRDHRWEELQYVLNALEEHRPDWSFWLLDSAWNECYRAGDVDHASSYFVQAEAKMPEDADDSALLSLAEGYWRLQHDLERVRQLFVRITAPGPYTDTLTGGGISPFLDRLRYGRLLYLLGESRDPRDLIRDPVDERHQGAVYVLRALYAIARVAADADRGQLKPWSTLQHEVVPMLRVFHQGGSQWIRWAGWHEATSIQSEFYAWLIAAAARHGRECLEGLKTAFEQEWGKTEKVGWPTDLKRKIILELHSKGADRQWTKSLIAAQTEHMLDGRDTSGRTEEYLAQANAWLRLQEPERVMQTLKEMLNVSFGVGYRKDYQLTDWIDWLGRILPVEPDKALDRIKWFARAAVSLDDTTEGKAAHLAANQLLTVVFRWSPRRAVTLLVWFMEQRCIWFADALSELLETALDTPAPPIRLISAFLRYFLMPVAREGHPDLAAKLLKVSMRQGGQSFTEATAGDLLKAVELRALPGTRYGWKKKIAEQLFIAGLTEPQVDPGPPPRDNQSTSDVNDRSLRLSDGREMSLDEVAERVRTLDEFRELFTAEGSDSFFDWEPVIKDVQPQLRNEDLAALAKIIESNRRATRYLTAISEELHRRGDCQRAWEVAEEALKHSARHGWSRRYDGGSRIAAFRALRAVDPDRSRPMLYHQLAEDEGCGTEALSQVLPLLDPNTPLSAVWNEMERFCRGMFPEGTLPDCEPSLSDEIPDDCAEMAFADLIQYFLTHPVLLLSVMARKACLELLLSNDRTAIGLINRALEADELQQEQALVVLGAAQNRNPNALQPFFSAVRKCSQSPQWLVRRLSQRLLESAGEVIPTVAERPLPLIYQLALPERPDTPDMSLPPPSADAPIVQFGSAEEQIGPFERYLHPIASRAGLGLRNMTERAASMMPGITPHERWSVEAERVLRSQLSAASLEMPFIRPRVGVARQAILRVVAELIDAGRVTPRFLDQFEGLCAFYDSHLEGLDPIPRDCQLVPRLSLGDMASVKAWVPIQDSDFEAMHSQVPDGRAIVAQRCKLKKLDWGAPSELRESTLRATDRHVAPSHSERIFGRVFHSHVGSYLSEEPDNARGDLVIQNQLFVVDTVGAEWLAFDPTLARSLGWQPSTQGLFRWTNAQGSSMVETLWWQDGTPETAPPHFGEEVGFGWVIVATQEAMEQIQRHVGPMVRLERISRHAHVQGEGEHSDVRTRALWG